MNCSDCQSALTEFVLGGLDARASEEVRAHLAAGCDACNDELRELNDDLACLGSVTPVTPPAKVKEQLLRYIGEQRESRKVTPAVAKVRGPWRLLQAIPYVAATVVGFSLGAVVIRSMQSPLPHVADVAEADHAARLRSSRLQLADPRFGPATLVDVRNSNAVYGTLTWDPVAEQLHIHAQLPALPKDRHYEARIETTSGEWHRLAQLDSQARGQFAAVAKLPCERSQVKRIIVIDDALDIQKLSDESLFEGALP